MSAYVHTADLQDNSRRRLLEFAPRRTFLGVFSSPAEEQGQPQDGVHTEQSMQHRPQSALSQALHEPEDARMTGGTRSLMRRVLGLNVTGLAVGSFRPARLRRDGFRGLPAAS